MVVPPTDEAISPIGTGSAPVSAASAARLSDKLIPKYQHTAWKRFGKPSKSLSSFPDSPRGSIQLRYAGDMPPESGSVLLGQGLRGLGSQIDGSIHELVFRGPRNRTPV